MTNRLASLVTPTVIGFLIIGTALFGGSQLARYTRPVQKGERPELATVPDAVREADREAIRAAARSFSEAFAKGDAKASASHWTELGVYEDQSGEVLRGRTAIESAFSDFFKEKNPRKMEIQILSIQF